MKLFSKRYKAAVPIFLFLTVVFFLSEILFRVLFYSEVSYWKSVVFGSVASLFVTYMLFKSGEIKTIKDILKYKKIKIAVSQKISGKNVYLIMEALKRNGYIVDTKKSNPNVLRFKSKSKLLDFGDIYTIKFLDEFIVIKSRPRIAASITDANRIASGRIKQVEKIVNTHCALIRI